MSAALKSYASAADLAGESGDTGSTIYAELGLGDVSSATGKFKEAREHYQTALDLSRSIDGRTTEAEALSGLGDVARKQNDKTAAIEHYRGAMQLYAFFKNEKRVVELLEMMDELGATPSPEGPEN